MDRLTELFDNLDINEDQIDIITDAFSRINLCDFTEIVSKFENMSLEDENLIIKTKEKIIIIHIPTVCQNEFIQEKTISVPNWTMSF